MFLNTEYKGDYCQRAGVAVALGAATLPYEGLFDRAWVKYLFENLFQNSIDFAQREYWFAIFECELIRAEGFLRRPYRL
jgi:hypothetical protein